MVDDQRDWVRELNDAFRRSFNNGRVVLTPGVLELEGARQALVLDKVRRFENFDGDNDPRGEHDFGSFAVEGEGYFWKIDYYDRELRGGSPDPGDPAQTTRVLTIMRPEEY